MKIWKRILLTLTLLSTAVSAEVVGVDVQSREDLGGCRSRGHAGCYETLMGRIHFEIDPESKVNQNIADIQYAPVNPTGRVNFSADFYLIKPKYNLEGNGSILFEAPNRGRKGAISRFHRGTVPSSDPRSDAELGDEFLLQKRFTVLWVG